MKKEEIGRKGRKIEEKRIKRKKKKKKEEKTHFHRQQGIFFAVHRLAAI